MNILFLWFILNSERLILAREQLRLRMWAASLLATLSFGMLGQLFLLAGVGLLQRVLLRVEIDLVLSVHIINI